MKDYWNSMSTIPISLSIFFLLICNYEDVFATPTMHLCRPEQRDALVQLKNEFQILNSSSASSCYVNGDHVTPHPKTESWVNNSDCCNWEGIKCNIKSGEVIELNLSCSYLSGRIHSNSNIENLHSLTILDLSYNDLSGQIMSSVRNLSHLTVLDLSNNNFNGEIFSSIENLLRLTSFDLSFNHIVGQIPFSIGNLSSLTSLDLSNNQILGHIPSSIGNLFDLTSLDLSNNQILGQVPSSIGNISHLRQLYLQNNNFSGQVPSTIGKASHLTSLVLSSNNFVGQIPSTFGSLNQLADLSVYSNMITGKIPVELTNLTELSFLSIGRNKLTGTLPINISSLSNLWALVANDNAFTGTLPSSLFTIPSLAYVVLANNQLNGTLDFGNISSIPMLQRLFISNNNFRGPIPSSISKFTNLESLDISHVNIQGPLDFSIFSHLMSLEYFQLSHLNTTTTIDLNDFLSYFNWIHGLDLSGNHVSVTKRSSLLGSPLRTIGYLNLSSCGIIDFPKLIRSQQDLVWLDLSNNKIKGQVPAWLWTLSRLRYVNLSNNTLINFERPTKHGLPLILFFLGSNNNFTGKIPSFICAFRSLSTLDFSNNNFNGSIPLCMGNLMRVLTYLNLRQNRLHGGLPKNLPKSLRSLDVGHNQLMGKFPRSLVNLSNLEVLNVESNLINDTFPYWLSYLPMLQVLVLRSNVFHGPIRQASFPKLRIIDISHNHFNGVLPSNYFVKWSAMSSLGTNDDRSNSNYMEDESGYYQDSMVLMIKGVEMELVRILKIYTALDFSGNKLEGEIPNSIGLLKELRLLNLSNNVFNGHIPSFMGNLRALESLDVSQNQLSGEIPQELESLNFLAIMNFSHNQLTGLVPGGTQFRRQKCSSFEDNMKLFGPSLDEVCKDVHKLASNQHQEAPETEEEDEEWVSWIATAIGSIPGTILGLTLGYKFFSYKSKWFTKRFGRNRR